MKVPRAFWSKTDQRMLAHAAVVLCAAVATGCLALLPLHRNLYVAGGSAGSSLLGVASWVWLIRVRTRYIVDRDRIIALVPDWLLRRHHKPTIRVFPFGICSLITDKPDLEATKVKLVRVDTGAALPISQSLDAFKELLAYVRERMRSEDASAFAVQRLDRLLAKGLQFHYGMGKETSNSSGETGLNALRFLLSLAGGPLGGTLGQIGVFASQEFISALSEGLMHIAGPRIILDRDAMVYHSLLRYTRIAYRDVVSFSIENRFGGERLMVRSDHESIGIKRSLVGFTFIMRVFLAKCRPKSWSPPKMPWTVPWSLHNFRWNVAGAALFGGAVTGALYLHSGKTPLRWEALQWQIFGACMLPCLGLLLLVWARRIRRVVLTQTGIEVYRHRLSRVIPISEMREFDLKKEKTSQSICVTTRGKPLQIQTANTRIPLSEIARVLHAYYPDVPMSGMLTDEYQELLTPLLSAAKPASAAG